MVVVVVGLCMCSILGLFFLLFACCCSKPALFSPPFPVLWFWVLSMSVLD